MADRSLHKQRGFSLIELLVVIVVAGILIAMAMQSMDVVVDDVRRVRTEREMEILAKAIVGDPGLTQAGARSDFGYVGDIGAFPPNLQALYQNTTGHATWNGPYLPPSFTQDSTGFRMDEWGRNYSYDGAVTITSNGGGSIISKKIAGSPADYLINEFSGTVIDGAGGSPGAAFANSVDVTITVPNGSGGMRSETVHPGPAGHFDFDSVPAGRHPLTVIYTPSADSRHRYATILPRHKNRPLPYYAFAEGYFTSGSGGGASGCDSSGTLVLLPESAGSITDLSPSGCIENWQCVDETTADEDATRVRGLFSSMTTDVYTLGNPATTDCAIVGVTVHARARKANTQGQIRLTLYTYSTDYNGGARDLTSMYADYSEQWTINPSTGSDWTWPEIKNLQAGISLSGQNSNFPAYCTRVWVEVQYAP